MKNRVLNAVASGGIVCLVFVAVCLYGGIAPFGNGTRTFACMDAGIQYLDFFSYYQDLVRGDTSILYSFDKGLGGTTIAVFSYYLSSPFNLVFLLVPGSMIQVAFNVVVMLKLMAAAVTASLFFGMRFPRLQNIVVILLPISYALMQYSFAQASNIMWLDGVYMLPLMALAVSNLVLRGKNVVPLALATGLSILFNWYSGAINCIAAVAWFFLELFLQRRCFLLLRTREYILGRGVRFAAAMLLGVALSFVLLLPTLLALLSGRVSGEGFSGFHVGEFLGMPLNILYGSIVGSESTASSASFYCGSVILLGCLALPFCRAVPIRTRVALVFLAVAAVASCYWQPLHVVFSLFMPATSYWFRYSYVCVFALAAIAATYYECAWEASGKREEDITAFGVGAKERVSSYRFFGSAHRCGFGIGASAYAATVPAAAVFSAVIIAMSVYRPYSSSVQVAITCGVLVFTSIILWFIGRREMDCSDETVCKSNAGKRWRAIGVGLPTALPAVLCVVVLCGELGASACMLLGPYTSDRVQVRSDYVDAQEDQVDAILENDDAAYRITQDATDNIRQHARTANYNEGLGFGYPTIASYTSSPVASQMKFLNAVGYRENGPNMNIVNTTMLGIDSLLSVKYAMLAEPVSGLVPRADLPSANGKSVYENPFALPLAFAVDVEDLSGSPIPEGNPFEVQNRMFSELAGHEVELYYPVACVSEESREGDRAHWAFSLGQYDGSDPLYGNIVASNFEDSSTLKIGEKEIDYTQWLAPSVFYIPAQNDDVSLDVSAANPVLDAQFYALDLDELEAVSLDLRLGADVSVDLRADSAEIRVANDQGLSLLVSSIPYDEGWIVTVNGKAVDVSPVFGCLMGVPLESGDNVIELAYSPKGWIAGCAVSAAALVFVVVLTLAGRRNKTF